MRPIDYTFENHGSIWLCRPRTTRALKHLRREVSSEATWFGPALVVEPRYLDGLVDGLRDNGWRV